MHTIVTFADLLKRIPTPAHGPRFALAMAHGSMSVELYAPVGVDRQQAHRQDELYVVARGEAEFVMDGQRTAVAPGHVLFVPAGADHRFENIGAHFATWVVFWGPAGGERGNPGQPGQ